MSRESVKVVASAMALGGVLASGTVLALSWRFSFPGLVLDLAWAVALSCVAVSALIGWRAARRQQAGFGSALLASLRSAGRCVRDLF